MADKRISDLPAATQWHPDAFIPQDNPAGLTEKVTPAQVEAKLEADGFVKAASPSLGQVAAYTAGGWAPIKLADANIDAAAAIGWGKISKTGAVATDVGALPEIVVTGAVNFNSINSGLPCSAEIDASSTSNAPSGFTSGKAHLLQSKGATNWLTQTLTAATAVAFRGMTSPGVWGAWRYAWDDAYLPISAFAQTLLDDANAAAARATLGALPVANPTATGLFTAPAIRNTGGTASALIKWDSDGDEVASGISDDGDDVKALSRLMYAKLFRSAWAASDTAVGGSSLGVLDAETAWTKGWMLQLGAANTLDFWNSVSSTWTRRAQILPDGSIVSEALAGTGTRAVAADSTGKIVVGSANIRTFGTASASFTYSASTPSVVRTTGAIYVTLPAAADFSGSETVFFQEYVGGNSLGFTGQTFESSVSSGSWVTHASGYGWSVAWRKIILSCDGITWYVVVQ